MPRRHPRSLESRANRRSCVRADVSHAESCQAGNRAAVRYTTRVARVAQGRDVCVSSNDREASRHGRAFLLVDLIPVVELQYCNQVSLHPVENPKWSYPYTPEILEPIAQRLTRPLLKFENLLHYPLLKSWISYSFELPFELWVEGYGHGRQST
jgi:hypothetical protein